MAKGNIFMGTLKGRIGDQVLYVSKGEQNVIKYQKHVANPQTNGQMYQRARFSNAGRFFTRGRQAFFKFAFEGKKKGTSDFNAFMKANINRSVLISKSALQVAGYPAIGKFIMSQGSLPALSNRIVNDYWQASFGIPAQSGSITTVGELSSVLIASNMFQQGDILTFVWLNTTSSDYLPAVKPQGNYYTDWVVKQFRVNVGDTTPLADYEMRAVSRNWNGINLLTLTDLEDSQMLSSAYGGFVAVHSRNVSGGLKVSTQELTIGDSMQDAYDYCQQDEYIQQVLEDWKSTDTVNVVPDAILKGSVSFQRSTQFGYTIKQAEGSDFKLSGVNLVATEPLDYGQSYVAGIISGTDISVDNCRYELISGSGNATVTFRQVDSNNIEIVVNTPTEGNERYSFTIIMRYGNLFRPVTSVSYTVGNTRTEFELVAPTPAEEYFPVTVNGNVATLGKVIAPYSDIAMVYLYTPAGVTEEDLTVVHNIGNVADDFVSILDQDDYMGIIIQGTLSQNNPAGGNIFDIMYRGGVVASIVFECSGVPLTNLASETYQTEPSGPQYPYGSVNDTVMPMTFTTNPGTISTEGEFTGSLFKYEKLTGFDISKVTCEKISTTPAAAAAKWSIAPEQSGNNFAPLFEITAGTGGNVEGGEFAVKYDGVTILTGSFHI